jgi:rhodanese-related sulfurtransferase
MAQLLEFAGNHPYLVTAALVLTAATLMAEMKARTGRGLMLGTAEAIRAANRGGLIIDLRDAESFARGHLAGATNIALQALPKAADEIAKFRSKPVLVCCETGSDSRRAVRALRSAGFEQAFGLMDGIGGWRRDNLPLVENPPEE